MTHEQYLDEPMDAVRWMLHIDDLRNEVEAKKQRAAGETS